MKRKNSNLRLLLFCLTPITVQSAGFDCTVALNNVESLICENPILSQLDDDLNFIYKQRLQDSKNTTSTKARQLAWLSDIRNKCRTVECLKTAYQHNIYAHKFDSPWMTNVRANKICANVLNSVNDGSLYERFIPFSSNDENKIAVKLYEERQLSDEYDVHKTLKLRQGDNTRVFGLIGGGGTCSSCQIADMNAQVFAPYPPDDERETLRWASWGTCDKLLQVENDLVVVKVGNFGNVSLISWFAPDGAQRPLCYIEPIVDNFKVTRLESQDKELCSTAISDKIKVVPWKNNTRPTLEERERLGSFDSKKTTEVDINLDGQLDTIGLFDHASGGGCGSYKQWVSVVTKSPESTESPALDTILRDSVSGPLKGNWSSSALRSGKGSIRIFHYKDKPYIIALGQKKDASIFSIWGNVLKTWCEYDILPLHTIEIKYPPKTWPLPIPLTKDN